MVDVYVVGQGPVELAAALEFAEVGLSVRIGRVATAAADGGASPEREGSVVRGDAVAGFSPGEVTDPDGTLREFLEHVASPLSPAGVSLEAARPIATPPVPVLLRGADGAWKQQPTPAVFGIPAVPLAQASLEVLGGRGAARAFLDRVRPVLTIGKTRSLGTLVRSRVGTAALDRLVDPLVRAKYGVDAENVDVAIAAPGLNEDVTTAGSLCGAALAYAERHVARETRVRPAGGWQSLPDTLLQRLELYGVEIADEPVSGVSRVVDAESGADGDASEWVIVETGTEMRASAVVFGDRAAELPGAPEDIAALGPRMVRWIAELSVTEPDFARQDAAQETAREATASAALEVVTGANRERWSAAWERDPAAASGWRLRVSGPAFASDRNAQQSGERSNVRSMLDGMLRDLLGAVGAQPAADPAIDLRLVPAPFATVAARDEALGHTTSPCAGESTCIRVGPEVHSGDLAAAICDAREKSVHLRRRLTGIAE